MNNKAVIVGRDHHNALSIVESLGRKGVHPSFVVLTKYKKCFVGESKYIENCWCCSDEESIIETLCRHFDDKTNKAVAYACDDETAVILDKNHAKLEQFLYLPTVTKAGTLRDWMQKERMSKLAEEVGMTVPQTWISNNNQIPDGIEYPIITKAHSSVEGGKDNLHICYNREDLERVFSKGHCDVMIIQQYIHKLFEFQFIGYAGEKTIVIPGRTEIVRPKGIDNTFFLSYDKYDKFYESLAEKAMEFVRRTGYTGTFSMEFLCDKFGDFYFTEMNFRNDGNAICVTEFGVNLPYIMYLDKTGQDISKEINPKETKKIWLYPELYSRHIFTGEVGVLEYLRNLHKTNCYTLYFKDDKKPFWKFIEYAIYKRLKML